MAYAAGALEAGDMERLFRVIDERTRHAIFSVVEDRQTAKALIERDYPPSERSSALRALGEGAQASSPAAFFALRCDAECQNELRAVVAAPIEEREDGDEHVVTTARGVLRVYRQGEGHWWGIVWRTDELDRERNRASRDRRQIEQNAETYRRRQELAAPSVP